MVWSTTYTAITWHLDTSSDKGASSSSRSTSIVLHVFVSLAIWWSWICSVLRTFTHSWLIYESHFLQKQDNSRMIILADKLSTITWWTVQMFGIGLKLKLPSLGIKSRNKKAVSGKQILSAPNSGSLKDSKDVRSLENSQSNGHQIPKTLSSISFVIGDLSPFLRLKKIAQMCNLSPILSLKQRVTKSSWYQIGVYTFFFTSN